MRSFFVLSFIVSLFFISCKDSVTETPPVTTSYLMPLAIGNKWYYRVEEPTSSDYYTTMQMVTKSITIRGNNYFVLRDSVWSSFNFLVQNVSNGLFMATNSSDTSFRFPILYKYPASDGEVISIRFQVPTVSLI